MKANRYKILFGALLSGAALSPAGNVFAQWRDQGYGYGPWRMGWGMMGWFGPVMMFLFWAAVIVAIILLIRWISASGGLSKGSTKGQDSALEILKKRYARGEINKDEFEQKKKDLS